MGAQEIDYDPTKPANKQSRPKLDDAQEYTAQVKIDFASTLYIV